jgi:hypothetical protein
MEINHYKVNVFVVMVVCVLQVHLVENFVNVLMDLLDRRVKDHFVGFILKMCKE